MILLRIVHIVTGVIWVGSLFVVVVFVQPSAAALGPAGAPFMSELRRRRFVDVVFIDALFTVVAGSLLYWRDWHTYPSFSDWIGSSFGTLTVGRVLGISGLGVAASLTRPTIRRLVSLGKQVAKSGEQPPPETAARIGALQHRLVLAERVSFSLVLLAVVAMASARYL
ncbi:MAG TPA: hypothetical protein VNG34_11385 [Actinomycetota bacterium]|nr:hypothetical protein [Actinomycetota bacterium]